MKKYIPIALFLFLCTTIAAQITQDAIINGHIIVPEGDEPEGIVVFNQTSNQSVVTDGDGSFEIIGSFGDVLTVTSLQFQQFSVAIDQGIMQSKKVRIFLKEAIEQLNEVVVTPYGLSGDIGVDINRLPTPEILVPNISADDTNLVTFRPDEASRIDNIAMPGRRVRGELNISAIIRALQTSNRSKKDISLEDRVQQAYDNPFFEEDLGLRQDQILDFIAFAEKKGLNEGMLKDGRELDLIAFLQEQSKAYKLASN